MWSTVKSKWAELKARSEVLFERYGKIAIGVWIALWLGSIAFFWVLLSYGFEVEGAEGAVSLGGAYVASQATKPIRLVLTLALTPVVARVLGQGAEPSAPLEQGDDQSSEKG